MEWVIVTHALPRRSAFTSVPPGSDWYLLQPNGNHSTIGGLPKLKLTPEVVGYPPKLNKVPPEQNSASRELLNDASKRS